MENEVRITIQGIQRDGEGNESVTESALNGQYYRRNGSRYLFYEEKPEGESGAVKHIIKLKNDLLELTKKGAVNTKMVFEQGKTHLSLYATPCGLLELGVQTHHVSSREQKNVLEIYAEYDLISSDVILSQCKIVIRAENAETTT